MNKSIYVKAHYYQFLCNKYIKALVIARERNVFIDFSVINCSAKILTMTIDALLKVSMHLQICLYVQCIVFTIRHKFDPEFE